MKGKVFSVVFALLVLCSTGIHAQYDPLYNQYNFDQLMINPGYTGIHDIMTMTLVHRRQWVDIEGAPVTNSLTGHTSIGNNKAGVGAIIINERFGVNNNTEGYVSFGYKINFGRSILSAGVQGGFMSYKYNYDELTLEVEDDPVFNPLSQSVSQSNFGVGLWWSTDNYYVGLSMPRMLNVEVDTDGGATSSRYRRHFYVSAGGMLTLNPTLKIKPYTLVRIVGGDSENNLQSEATFDIGANLLIRELIWAGALYRNTGGIALMGQMELNDQLRLGYSLELATTQLVTTSYGTHEIMLILDLAVFSQQVLKRRYF